MTSLSHAASGFSRTLAIVCGLPLAVAACEGTPPNDAQLATLFEGHRGALERLRDDACAVAPQTVRMKADDSEPKLSPESHSAFLALMAEVDASYVGSIPAEDGRTPFPCSVDVKVWTTGFLDQGDDRSFVYAPRPDKDDLVVPDLERVDIAATVHHFEAPSSHGHRRYMKKLAEAWWLVREYWQ